MGRDDVAGHGMRIPPDPKATGGDDLFDPAGAGAEVGGRILGIDAALEGMAAGDDVLLLDPQFLTGGDADLGFDEVDPGHQLAHRVLDLDPGVDLDEVEVALLIDDKLDRAGGVVAGGLAQPHRRLTHRLAGLRGEPWGRALLDELLVAPLRRAIALPEVEHRAVGVAEDLHLDMPRPVDVALHIDAGITERR